MNVNIGCNVKKGIRIQQEKKIICTKVRNN